MLTGPPPKFRRNRRGRADRSGGRKMAAVAGRVDVVFPNLVLCTRTEPDAGAGAGCPGLLLRARESNSSIRHSSHPDRPPL